MARQSRSSGLDDAIERRRRERDEGGDRLIDLRLDFEDESGEIVLSVGGRWDRRFEENVGDATTGVVVRYHPGQRAGVLWFAAWLEAHRGRRENPPPPPADLDDFELDTSPEHVYSALFAGGRRAGKTWIAMALAVAYAIEFPGAIVWLVSPNDQKHEEVRRYIAALLAPAWVDRETAADGWDLVNGSTLALKSAYGTGDGLKEGEADFVVLNEGQMMKARAFTVVRGAIVDRSGLVLVCANPPLEAKDQVWVADFAAAAAAGRRASVYLEFNPLLNPHIDRTALLAFRADVDERTFAIEVLGQFRGPPDAVAWNWIRIENERPMPTSGDVTADFLASQGEGLGFRQVIGIDVQRFPYIGGPIYRFFHPGVLGRAGEPDYEHVIAWIIGEVVLEGGDELDLGAAMHRAGLKPRETLLVVDASGRYQHSRRSKIDAPPPEWKGKGSFDLFRQAGYRRIVPPDRRQKRNPEIVDRARAFTSLICSGVGVRRLFADPELAPLTCGAIRDWRTKNGKPSRSQNVAHLGDGASYPIVRLFPRRLRSGKPGAVDPIASKVDSALAPEADRVLPPTRGPAGPRRGDRFRGL